MQCWFVVTFCCVLFFISVSVPISGWYLAIAVPLPVAPVAAPIVLTGAAPKALVAAGAPNREVLGVACCWPKKDPVAAVLAVFG